MREESVLTLLPESDGTFREKKVRKEKEKSGGCFLLREEKTFCQVTLVLLSDMLLVCDKKSAFHSEQYHVLKAKTTIFLVQNF